MQILNVPFECFIEVGYITSIQHQSLKDKEVNKWTEHYYEKLAVVADQELHEKYYCLFRLKKIPRDHLERMFPILTHHNDSFTGDPRLMQMQFLIRSIVTL